MELAVFLVAGAVVLGGALGVVLSRNPVHAALSLVASLFGVAVLFVAQEAHLLAAVQVIVYTGAIVVLILFVLMLLGVDEDEDIGTEPLTAQRPLAIIVGGLGLLGVIAVLLVPVITADSGGDAVAPAIDPTTGLPAVDPVTGQPIAQESDAPSPGFEDTTLTGAESQTAPLYVEVPVVDPETGLPEVDPLTGAPTGTERVETKSNIEVIGEALFTDYVYAFEVTALLLTIAVVGAVLFAKRVRDTQPLPEPDDNDEDDEAVRT